MAYLGLKFRNRRRETDHVGQTPEIPCEEIEEIGVGRILRLLAAGARQLQ